VNSDCIYFNGYKPCKPHKEQGVHCEACGFYQQAGQNILIIKFQAAGEVIRNTPLLERLENEYKNPKIFWVTNYPDLIPKSRVFKILKFNNESALLLRDIEFDLVLSLDKDLEACALANSIRAKKKKGFTQKDGVILPFDEDARRKWETGIFDDLMKKNKKHYMEEIFEMCGYDFKGEEYILPEYVVPKLNLDSDGPIIALNTGAGNQWVTRIYSEAQWISVARILLEKGYSVIIVGGPAEDNKNKKIAKESGAVYPGLFKYSDFIGLLSLADVVVTCVTFAFHAAVGLHKKVVLLNNIFNKNEFYTYGRGTILEPNLPCLMCYKTKFDEKCPTTNCMDLITPKMIMNSVEELLSKRKK